MPERVVYRLEDYFWLEQTKIPYKFVVWISTLYPIDYHAIYPEPSHSERKETAVGRIHTERQLQ